MAHFAELNENNQVMRVIVVSNNDCGEPTLAFPDTCPAGRAFIANKLGLPGTWKQCSYNASFRGAYPGQGWIYDADLDEFVAPAVYDETE
jgi:hypothetical protein